MIFLYDAYEDIEPIANDFISMHYVPIKFIILFAILIAIGLFIIFHPSEQNKKDTKKFLESLIPKIYTIAVANIEYVFDENSNDTTLVTTSDFKDSIISMVYEDAWSYVDTCIDKAVTDGKIDYVAKRLIKKANVEQLVDLVMNRKDINNKLEDVFETLSNSFIQNMLAEDKAAAEEAARIEAEPEDEPETADTEEVEAFPNPEVSEEQLATIQEPYEDDGVEIIMEDGMDDGSREEDTGGSDASSTTFG